MTASSLEVVVLCGISPPFGRLSPARGNVTHVLLTRAPLYRGRSPFSCDLHVLGAPLTFVLSQDQTLQLNLLSPQVAPPAGGTELGLWLLEIGESLRLGTSYCRRRPRALLGTHSSTSSPRARDARVEDAKASVRFSFQGPREPDGSRSGGGNLSCLPDGRQGRESHSVGDRLEPPQVLPCGRIGGRGPIMRDPLGLFGGLIRSLGVFPNFPSRKSRNSRLCPAQWNTHFAGRAAESSRRRLQVNEFFSRCPRGGPRRGRPRTTCRRVRGPEWPRGPCPCVLASLSRCGLRRSPRLRG